MNCYDKMFKTIKKLIENKSISKYQINKDIGFSYGNLNSMKNAKISYEYANIHLSD